MSQLEELEDPALAYLAGLMEEVLRETAILAKARAAEPVISDWVPN
jgi:hypothetical protein